MTNPTIQTSAPNELKEILTTHNVHFHCLIMRGFNTWTSEEEVVLGYYAIRNINHDSIIEILANKFNTTQRTRNQINQKVAHLRLLNFMAKGAQKYRPMNGQDWMLRHTDQWILRTVARARLDVLLDHDSKTAAIIGEVTALKTSSKV